MAIIKDRDELVGICICVVSAIIFGLYPPAARIVYQEGGNISFVVFVTTVARFFCLYGLALVKDLKPFADLKTTKISFILGIIQAISIIGILGATFFMPGAIVIIIMFTYSLMLLVFSAWRGEIKLNKVNILSTVFALIGLGLVLKVSSHGISYPLIGILLAFMSAVATFARTYMYGHQTKTKHPLVVGAEVFTFTCLLLIALLVWKAPIAPQSTEGLTMIAAAALSLSLGSIGMFYGIAYLAPYKFSMIMKLEPVFTTLFGIILVNDILDTSQYLGIAIVLASLIGLQLYDRQKQ